MYIGIDPGLTGALAVLDHVGTLVALYDTPTLILSTSRGRRTEYDLPGMATMLWTYTAPRAHVLIEASQAMPGQGVASTWTTGYGYGAWVGLLAALQIAYTIIRPASWKRALGLGKDKEAARLRAMQLYPKADLRHKRDHGRAEALLLVWYGVHHLALKA